MRNWISRTCFYHPSADDAKVEEEGHNVAELNMAAFQKEIVLTHMVARKRRLEEEFLEITRNLFILAWRVIVALVSRDLYILL